MPLIWISPQFFPLGNSFQDDTISHCSKLKVLLEKKKKIVSNWVENIVVKEEKCWLPAFSLLPTIFLQAFCVWIVKSWHCMVNG